MNSYYDNNPANTDFNTSNYVCPNETYPNETMPEEVYPNEIYPKEIHPEEIYSAEPITDETITFSNNSQDSGQLSQNYIYPDVVTFPGRQNYPASSYPETLQNPIYTPAYLRQHIGRWMRVQFLIGNSLIEQVGRLTQVGASYIVLENYSPNTSIMCDIYSIKFASIVKRSSTTPIVPL